MKSKKSLIVMFCIAALFLIGGIAICVLANYLGKLVGSIESYIIFYFLGAVLFLIAVGAATNSYYGYRYGHLKSLTLSSKRSQITNEVMFNLHLDKVIKKNPSGFLISYTTIKTYDQLKYTFGFDKADRVLEIMDEASSLTVAAIYNSFYSKLTNGAYIIYLPCTTKEELEGKIKLFESNFQEGLAKENIYSKIQIRYGCLDLTKYHNNTEELIQNTEYARISIEDNDKSESAISYYNDNYLEKTIDETAMREEIDRAIKNNEFVIYYQPKIDLKLNKVGGAEALIRWNHPTKGQTSPGSFIPFAEKSNQIVAIDRYVFRHVLADIAKWKKNGLRLVPVSINLSRSGAYQPDLIQFIRSSLSEFGVSPQLIEIELTESAIAQDITYIGQTLRQINNIGIKTDMDDFGTGYSSLSMLKKMPINIMKVDKSFFDDIEIDKRSRDIVKSIISLGKTCGLTIVAEGIETEKQLQFLKTTKCDLVQGHYFSTAVSRVKFEKMLTNINFTRKERSL